LIYNTHDTGDDHRYDNNNDDNDITKYHEFNKVIALDLAEKHYENLVEVLTNNAIDSAAYSNFTLPSPSSSSSSISPFKPKL
jgi:hypothetical protein